MISDTQAFEKVQIKKGIGLCLLVLAVLLLITWIAMALNLDIAVGRLFFSEEGGWIYKDAQPWRALYLYGTVPGLVFTLGALLLFFLGFAKSRWQRYQKYMLVIVLTSILGAGVLVNSILKPYCGRPRPRDIVAFNGQWDYCSPCLNSTPGKGMSFPCGHCTMGFLFVTLIYLRRKSPLVAYGGAVFGLSYGILLGVARAAQGAHFATDTLWSLGVLVIVSLLIYYILIPLLEKSWLRRRAFTRQQIIWAAVGTFLVVVAIAFAFLTRRPFYEMFSHPLVLPPQIRQVVVHSNVDLEKSAVAYANRSAKVALLSQGFGWTNAKEAVTVTADIRDQTLYVRVRIRPDGYFAELDHQLFLTLPASAKDRIAVQIVAQSHHE